VTFPFKLSFGFSFFLAEKQKSNIFTQNGEFWTKTFVSNFSLENPFFFPSRTDVVLPLRKVHFQHTYVSFALQKYFLHIKASTYTNSLLCLGSYLGGHGLQEGYWENPLQFVSRLWRGSAVCPQLTRMGPAASEHTLLLAQCISRHKRGCKVYWECR